MSGGEASAAITSEVGQVSWRTRLVRPVLLVAAKHDLGLFITEHPRRIQPRRSQVDLDPMQAAQAPLRRAHLPPQVRPPQW
jgi:hypothetical protein